MMHSGGNDTNQLTFSPGNASAMTARMGVISLPSALLSHAQSKSVAFVPSFEVLLPEAISFSLPSPAPVAESPAPLAKATNGKTVAFDLDGPPGPRRAA